MQSQISRKRRRYNERVTDAGLPSDTSRPPAVTRSPVTYSLSHLCDREVTVTAPSPLAFFPGTCRKKMSFRLFPGLDPVRPVQTASNRPPRWIKDRFFLSHPFRAPIPYTLHFIFYLEIEKLICVEIYWCFYFF